MTLRIHDVSVQYGKMVAVRNVSLEVERREFVCIIGPNGAGKSTLLLAVSGLRRPTKGSITYDGHDLLRLKPEQIARLGISHVPEGRHVFTGLTVEENMMLGTHMCQHKAQIMQDRESMFEMFPVLAERRRQVAGMLSGGEQQMLVISRAIMSGATLITVDEPSLGLAPAIADRVYRVLDELRRTRELTVLVLEQSIERAIKSADRICVMRQGCIQVVKGKDEFTSSEEFLTSYFGNDGQKEVDMHHA